MVVSYEAKLHNVIKESESVSLDDAKWIVSSLIDDVVSLRVSFGKLPKGEELDKIINHLKKLNQHQVYLDGGKSYQEFWDIGESIIEDLESTIGH